MATKKKKKKANSIFNKRAKTKIIGKLESETLKTRFSSICKLGKLFLLISGHSLYPEVTVDEQNNLLA